MLALFGCVKHACTVNIQVQKFKKRCRILAANQSAGCAMWLLLPMQNAAVESSNQGLASSSKAAAVHIACLRHMACELLHAVPANLLQEFQQLQLINFCLKVLSWQRDVLLAMDRLLRLCSQHGCLMLYKQHAYL
jgi:hypothetical protein